MKITSVKATRHRVPVEVPLLSKPLNWNFTMVRVETDEGHVGHGVTGPRLISTIAEFINSEVDAFVRGYDPMETERIWRELYSNFNGRAVTGVWSSAVSALDIALWDVKGKALGQNVARLLGGAYRQVPAYITYGLAELDKDQLVELARILVDQGQDKLKIVVGGYKHPLGEEGGDFEKRSFYSTVTEDAERIRAVRDAIGPDVELMIDANYMFNYPDALRLCRLIEECDIKWFEEPMLGNDPTLMKELKSHTKIPLSGGQNFGHQWAHRDLIMSKAVDICQPNVCHVGGFTEGVKVANLARAFNVQIANGGGWPHYNLHLHAGVSNGWRVEYHWLHAKACEAVLDGAPQPERGWMAVPEKPGLGFDPIEDALEEYLVKG